MCLPNDGCHCYTSALGYLASLELLAATIFQKTTLFVNKRGKQLWGYSTQDGTLQKNSKVNQNLLCTECVLF